MQVISIETRIFFFSLLSFLTSEKRTTATSLDYHINAYECDGEMRMLNQENRLKKNIGRVYRVCFEPNDAARSAGVGIKNFDSWEWETDFVGGNAVQEAVVDGKGIGGVTFFECLDGGNLCILDTVLTADFFNNPGTVFGNGKASFTAGTESVPVEFNLFQAVFKFKFDDELDDLMKNHVDSLQKQEELETVKEEL